MELVELINKINKHHDEGGEGFMYFPAVVDDLPEKFTRQECEIDGIEYEWLWQVIDQFDCYHGELAYKFKDRYLVFGFSGY